MMPHGEPIQIEFTSADASTAVAVGIRDAGTNTPRTLVANERVYLQTLVFNVFASGTLTVFDDSNANGAIDANETLAVVGAGTTFIQWEGTDQGTAGGLGRIPKVKASGAGLVYVTGTGAIRKT
jgi:hypothetical protein